MKHAKKILLALLFSFLFIILTLLGTFFFITKNEKLIESKLSLSDKTIAVYSANGKIVANALENENALSLQEIPLFTRNAFVNTEDKRFYSHHGFDVRRIAKATLKNAKARSFKEGASTISQQLIKNTHLTQEKTLSRKLKEWKLTRALEKSYSKDEILEKYLRVIYFGHNCFGLRAAARFYFNKTPAELDLADSAILAGLVKSPNNYSPFKNPEKCLKRKLCVLNCMLANGSITEKEKRIAMQKPLPDTPNLQTKNNAYLHYVYDEFTALTEENSFPTYGNIEIHTYLNEDLQTKMEHLYENYDQTDFTMLSLNNQTHGYTACVSSIYGAKRLPGSLLKPLLVYAPALEEKLLSPATPLLDEPINFNGYAPENYDNTYHGYVSVRECVAQSLNIPAVKVLNSLGLKTCANYAQTIGLPIENDDLSLTLALGGMKQGYTLAQLVSAYSTLPCDGEFTQGNFIAEIKADGKCVYKKPNESKHAFSKESAYLTTDMLKSTAKTGTAKKLRSLPFPIAAKTGTVGTEKGNTDAYAVCYTPLDTVGVWLGKRDNSFITQVGGGLPCNFLYSFNEYLAQAYEKQNLSIPDFNKPQNVNVVELDKIAYDETHTLSLADELAPAEYRFTELFNKDCIPTKTSDYFSNPTINAPILRYDGEKILLTFEKEQPFYYYKIERNDFHENKTVYQGVSLKEFKDLDIEQNKNYVYTVIPFFKERQGQPVVLPTVTTKLGEPPPQLDKKILEKNWWEY